MKRIVRTGAAGFIGSNISNHLYRLGYHLVLVDSLEYGGEIMRLCEDLRSKLIIDNLQSMQSMNFVQNADIWNKHNTIFSKISHDRIEKEVHKESLGSNEKLEQFLGRQLHFIKMRDGLEEMLNQKEGN